MDYGWHISSLLRTVYRNNAHVSCRRQMPHLGTLTPKGGTAGQASKHEEKGAREVVY